MPAARSNDAVGVGTVAAMVAAPDHMARRAGSTREPAEEVTSRGPRRRRLGIAAVVAPVSAVAVAAVVAAVIAGTPQERQVPATVTTGDAPPTAVTPFPSSPATPAPPTATVGAAAPALLRRGAVAPRTDVPWAQVGPGWSLVTTSTASPDVLLNPLPKPVPYEVSLFVMNPVGGRYLVTSWHVTGSDEPTLVAWSGDGRRALLQSTGTSGPVLEEVDLHSGASRVIPVHRLVDAVGYSRPSGTRVMVAVPRIRGGIVTGDDLYRLDPSAAHPTLTPFAPGLLVSAEGGAGWMYTPDGSQVVVVQSTGLSLYTNAGTRVRSLAGGASCGPVRWWTDQVLLASCGATQPRLWLVPVSGAPATALTAPRGTAGPDLGDIKAWQLSSGLYVEALSACGSRILVRQRADGSIVVVHVPGDAASDLDVLASLGSDLAVRTLGGCRLPSSLVWFHTTTGRSSPLLPAPAGQQGVTAAIFYGRSGAAA